MHTGRGVPYAILGLVRYTLIFLGFLVGLAAADFELVKLAIAIQEAVEHAGIGVPFPQRDLHLVSASPNAASDLGTATRPSPRPTPPTGSSDGG